MNVPRRVRRCIRAAGVTAVATSAVLSLGWQAPSAVAEAGVVPFLDGGGAHDDFLASLPADLAQLDPAGGEPPASAPAWANPAVRAAEQAATVVPVEPAAPALAGLTGGGPGPAPAAAPVVPEPSAAVPEGADPAPVPALTGEVVTPAPPAPPATVAPPTAAPAPAEPAPAPAPEPAPPVAPAPEPAPPPAPAPAVLGPAAVPASVPEATFLSLLNHTRAGAGAGALHVDAGLRDAAQRWAEHLAAAGGLAHQPLEPVLATGFSTVAENVAMAESVQGCVDVLVGSPAHFGNLANPAFRAVGIGVAVTADGRVFTAHLFGG